MTRKKLEIVWTPEFTKSINDNVPPEDREAVLQAIAEFTERLAKNPYAGTPLWGGWLNPAIKAWNWVKRTVWDWGMRW